MKLWTLLVESTSVSGKAFHSGQMPQRLVALSPPSFCLPGYFFETILAQKIIRDFFLDVLCMLTLFWDALVVADSVTYTDFRSVT